MISVEEARAQVLAAVQPLGAQEIALADALGRVLAEDVANAQDVPPFDSSAMDGFALGTEATGVVRVVGESRAGAPFAGPLGAHEAIRISTGAQVPEGAATVVAVERTSEAEGGVDVGEPEPGRNIRRAGEDGRTGETVLRAGVQLGAAELGVLAGAGRARVLCSARPRVAIVATGDELRPPGAELAPGQIWSSNPLTLAAQVQSAGGEVCVAETVGDEAGATRTALQRALEASDVVCVSGGVSVGEHDHVKAAFTALGVQERFWGVALRPGKPTWFGTAGATLCFGLPGNPVSAMVTFHLFARPALRALQGAEPLPRRSIAQLAAPVKRHRDRSQAIRVRVDDGRAAPTGPQGSHQLTSMLGADALALIGPGDGEITAGQRVDIEPLR